MDADETPNRRPPVPARRPAWPRARRRAWYRVRPSRRTVVASLVVLSLLLGASAWTGLRADQARDHLLTAAELMKRLQAEISVANIAAAEATFASLQVEAAAARRQTDDPVWRLASHLPYVGGNLAAVTTIAETLDDLVHNGVPPLIAMARNVNPAALEPRDGHINVAMLDQAGPQIRAADLALRAARDRVATIDTDGLFAPVAAAVVDLRAALDHAAGITATAVLAATLLPPMLGARGPRTYMVLFQNLAEPRATGGELGAYAIVRADQGRIEISEQGTASGDLQAFDQPVLPLDPRMVALYSDRLGRFPADVNATPHFPTAAALARQMYTNRTGRTVDAVLATDPVALSYLLAATGAVPVPGGPALTRENAVRELLSEAYFRLAAPADQDRYFADASRIVFDTLARGHGDAGVALKGLVRAASERRVLVWSADPAEQALLADTVLGGVLPEHDGDRPTVGIFLNDGTGAKLGYYLTRSGSVRVGGCRADGRREVTVTTTLGSTAPATGLPTMVTGFGDVVGQYTLRTNLMVFSPAGGTFVSAKRDGVAVPIGSGTERGRAVAVTGVDLGPGQRATVEITMLTGVLTSTAGFTPDLWTTPGITAWPVTVDSAAPCGEVR